MKTIDQEANAIPLGSIDRMIMTSQALFLQNKMHAGQRIKSISEIGEESNGANTRIELVDEITGKCSSLKAAVYNGYLDENDQPSEKMNTIVKFVGPVQRCK